MNVLPTEVDRPAVWNPVSARRHRREAEEKLGAKFDRRTFHDVILAIGSVPLPVLEQRMTQFIADGGVNPSVGR